MKSKVEAAKKAYEEEKKATGENSDASKQLKEELDKLEQEFKDNETQIGKTESALSNQATKVNNSKVKLMEMKDELEKTNKELKNHKLDVFADACDKAGQKIEGFGKKMSIVSGGIVALGTASIASFKELDEGYDTIVTKTGASGEALEGLTNVADNIFGSMPEDMATVGEAVGEVNTRFHSTGEELESLSEQFVQFSSINGTNVTQSVDQVHKIMQAWNIDTSETGNLLGLLTSKAQETGISVDSLESYVLDNNSAFKEMGLSLPQAINLMAQFDANGVDTTQALGGLKKALQNATDEGKSMDVALEETIGSIKSAKTDTEALQIATDLFGKKGAAEMATAIRENRIDLSSLSASMSEYSTVVADTYNGTLDPIDNAKVAMNNAKIAMSDLASTAQTAAAPVIESVTSKIQELRQWFTSLDEGQQQTIIKAGLAVAAVGPLAVGFGKVGQGISSTVKTGQQFVSGAASLIGKITGKTAATAADTAATVAQTTATTAATTATTALGMAMKLLKGLGIAAAIFLIVEAGVWLYKNWDMVKEKAAELGTKLKAVFGNIKESVTNAFSNVKEAVSDKLSSVKDAVQEKWDEIQVSYWEGGGGVSGILEVLFDEQANVVSGAFNLIQKITGINMEEAKEKVVTEIQGIRNTVVDFVYGIQEKVANSKFGQAAAKVMTAASDTVKEKLNNIKTAYEENGGGIKGVVAAGWEGIKGFYTSGFTFIDNLTGGKLSAVKEKVQNGLQAVRDAISNAFETVKNVITVAIMAIKSIIDAAVQIITLPFRFIWENCKDIVIEVWESIKEKVHTAITAVHNVISPIMTAIKDFVVNIWTAISDTVAAIVEGLREAVTKAWETVKSKVTAAVNAVKAVIIPIWNGIKSAVTSAVNAIKTVVTNVFNAVKDFVKKIWDEVASVIKKAVETAKSNVESRIKAISNFVQNTFNALKDTVKKIWDGIKSAIETPINAAKDAVKNAIDFIKNAFDFEWSLPDLKLPHFKIEGSFSLNPPSVPKLSIDWYKTGGIMTTPTAFGINGTRLMVGGEAGAEAILPLEEFYTRLGQMLDSILNSGGSRQGSPVNIIVNMDDVLDRLERIEARINSLSLTEIVQLVPDERKLFKIVKKVADTEAETTGKQPFGAPQPV
ncbi:MAG: phage tail tape measure protein [Butyrivibrio sp.]|nr:phage tail tape measure protein [Butyrivibrio sp.]